MLETWRREGKILAAGTPQAPVGRSYPNQYTCSRIDPAIGCPAAWKHQSVHRPILDDGQFKVRAKGSGTDQLPSHDACYVHAIESL